MITLTQSIVNALLADDTPQANSNTSKTGEKGEVIGRPVTSQAVRTLAVTVLTNNGVAVVDSTVQKVEDVATEDWGQSHDAPVLGEAINAKGVCGQGWEDPEQETVCNTREA